MKNSGTVVFRLKYLRTEKKEQSLQSHMENDKYACSNTHKKIYEEASTCINVKSSTSQPIFYIKSNYSRILIGSYLGGQMYT